MMNAIDGIIIKTPEIFESINVVYNFRVPYKWKYDPTSAEIFWLTATLAAWLKGLVDRYHQLNSWVQKERPQTFRWKVYSTQKVFWQL